MNEIKVIIAVLLAIEVVVLTAIFGAHINSLDKIELAKVQCVRETMK